MVFWATEKENLTNKILQNENITSQNNIPAMIWYGRRGVVECIMLAIKIINY